MDKHDYRDTRGQEIGNQAMSNDIEQLAELLKEKFLEIDEDSEGNLFSHPPDWYALSAYVLREREKACLEARLEEMESYKYAIKFPEYLVLEKDINDLKAKLADLKGRKDDEKPPSHPDK